MTKNAEYYIKKLGLEKHKEGGYYKETYRSFEKLKANNLPTRFTKDHNLSTTIYYLIKNDDPSKLHRLKADEGWHFYAGSPVKITLINQIGDLRSFYLGNDLENNQSFQAMVPANVWFGAEVEEKDGFALVGCTVTPGFEFDDFEFPDKDFLLQEYPQHEDIINRLT